MTYDKKSHFRCTLRVRGDAHVHARPHTFANAKLRFFKSSRHHAHLSSLFLSVSGVTVISALVVYLATHLRE
jgi:hypothetical protein